MTVTEPSRKQKSKTKTKTENDEYWEKKRKKGIFRVGE